MAKTEKVILAAILFIGAALRIYNYWDFSLSNDELSALARLNFNSFSELLHKGIKIDGHPPAAQVILYYTTKVFGNSVAVVRFPFVLAGILAIYYMYQLAKEWISSSAGLLSAALFASLSFPILYSRIARPYALGMLFVLMAATYWIRILKEKGTTKDFILLAISLTLCAYSHYFSAMVATILAISGTFIVKGENLKKYLVALVVSFILYLPYIPFFLYQLSVGGVGQWLGTPENDWLFEHIDYVFNHSWLVKIPVLVIAILGFALFNPKKSFFRNVLPFILFFLPFLIGFLYSKNINPVLQHSTLLFSFPFLLVFAFSGWEDAKPRITVYMTTLLLLLSLGSTTVEKRFFQTNYFGVFKEIAENLIEWKNESKNDALLIGDFNYTICLHYYTDKIEPLKLDLYRTTNENGPARLKALVENSDKEYLIYG
ncbi:MAG: glycosyltransferase family 39 protein, partial [Flavobacteriales bacterium]